MGKALITEPMRLLSMDIIGFLFIGVVSDVTVYVHGRALSERKAPGDVFQE